MPFSKQAHEAATSKVAAADRTEREHAIDAGFGLACRELGLNDAQTKKLAKVAVARVEAAKAKLAAPGPINAINWQPPKPVAPAEQPPAPVAKPGQNARTMPRR